MRRILSASCVVAAAVVTAAMVGACGEGSDSQPIASGGGTGGSAGASGDAGTAGSGPDSGPIQSGELTIWTQPVSKKIQPTSPQGTGGEVVAEALRDSYVSYELVLRARSATVQGVELHAGDLSDGNGHSIAASELTLFREYQVDLGGVQAIAGNEPVPTHSSTQDTRVPDPLIPLVDPYSGAALGAPFNVPADENQAIWLDIHVPESTVAGTYSGSITVSTSETVQATVPVTLVVRNVVLPDMRTVRTHFPMRSGELIRYHRDIYDCSGSSCYLEWYPQSRTVVKRYEELAHEHRIDPGQNFVRAFNGCTPPSDWSEYDAAIAPYMSGAYWSDGVPSSRLETPFSPGVDYGVDGDCTHDEYVALTAAWASHLKARGWWNEALAFALDEPEPSQYQAIADGSSRLQQGDPGWKARVLLTEAPRFDSIGLLGPAVGIFVVPPKEYDSWTEPGDSGFFGRQDWPGLMASGTRLWFYESNSNVPPFPTFSSNTLDALEPVIFMWGSWFEHATGFLLWSINAWPQDESAWGPDVVFGKFGDGILLYPGNHDGTGPAALGSPPEVAVDGPIPSLRLKALRQGLQDWALFQLAEDKGMGGLVREKVSEVYSQLGGCSYQGCTPPARGFYWSSDAAVMERIRHEVVDALESTP